MSVAIHELSIRLASDPEIVAGMEKIMKEANSRTHMKNPDSIEASIEKMDAYKLTLTETVLKQAKYPVEMGKNLHDHDWVEPTWERLELLGRRAKKIQKKDQEILEAQENAEAGVEDGQEKTKKKRKIHHESYEERCQEIFSLVCKAILTAAEANGGKPSGSLDPVPPPQPVAQKGLLKPVGSRHSPEEGADKTPTKVHISDEVMEKILPDKRAVRIEDWNAKRGISQKPHDTVSTDKRVIMSSKVTGGDTDTEEEAEAGAGPVPPGCRVPRSPVIRRAAPVVVPAPVMAAPAVVTAPVMLAAPAIAAAPPHLPLVVAVPAPETVDKAVQTQAVQIRTVLSDVFVALDTQYNMIVDLRDD